MLVEFSVENFRSFADRQTLSLVASRDKSLEQNTIAAPGVGRLLKTVALFGPNGGGKSNLVRALATLRWLVVYSFAQPAGVSRLPVESFRLDPALRDGPCTFEVTFVQDAVRYEYGVSVTREHVEEEWLFAAPTGQAQRWFHRERKEGKDTWYFGPHLKGAKQSIASQTRENVLFLSAAAQLNHEQLTPVHAWFAERLRPLVGGLPRPPEVSTSLVPLKAVSMEMMIRSPERREQIVTLLKNADTGISDITIEEDHLDPASASKVAAYLPEDQRASFLANPRMPQLRTWHTNSDGTQLPFGIEDESAGTRQLFNLAGPLLETLERGYTMVADEDFLSFHTNLVQRVITEIHDHDAPPAQLIFTSHDVALLDQDLLRRDQIYFLEKNARGRSLVVPLLDFRPRKGESLSMGYLNGRYGALPFLERLVP